MAADDRPQAYRDALSGLDHGHVLDRRLLRHADPAGSADPDGRAGDGRHLQQAVHHARDHHGLLLPDSVGAGGDRQFRDSADGGRQGPGLPARQPAELVSLHGGCHHRPHSDGHRRGRYRLDLLHAVQHDVLEYPRDRRGARHLHRRLLFNPDRAELHRHHPPHARARD